MLETSARLLALLALLQGRRSWSGAELAQELGVTARTLRRDIERLRALGYDVDAVSGPGGGYQFGAGALPPLLLSEDEAVTVTVALRTLVEGPAGGAGEQGLGVLVKLDRLLPERLRGRVAALHSQTVVLSAPGQRVDATVLSRLAGACRDSEAVRLRYRTAGGEVGERTVAPLRLAHTGNRRWYLVGWEEARAGWRTYRVDRIESILAVGPRVVRPAPPPDLEQYVSESIGAAPYPCRARLALDGPRSELAAKVPPWVGVLRETGPASCELDIGGATWEAVVLYAVAAGVEFRVLDPPELIPVVEQVAARLGRAAARS